MYAIIENGGQQFKVVKGSSLKVQKLALEPEQELEIKALMLVNNEQVKVSQNDSAVAKVMAKVKAHGRYDKIKIIKHKRRKHHMKRMGHRQWFTEVEITDIKEA